MNKKQRDITIMAVGERRDFDSYKKFNRAKRHFKAEGFHYASVTYKRLLQGKLPEIATEKVIVFFFFPFAHWNQHIEHKNYKGLYGNTIFYRKFLRFGRR